MMAGAQESIDLRQLLSRLMDDHQRQEPHHAHLCELCMDTKRTIDSLVDTPTGDESLLALIGQCADRALVHRPQDETPFYFTALLGEVLCHDGADVGPRLLDLIDAATLQPSAPAIDLLNQVQLAVEASGERSADYRAYYFIGRLEAIVRDAGRPDLAASIDTAFGRGAGHERGAPQ